MKRCPYKIICMALLAVVTGCSTITETTLGQTSSEKLCEFLGPKWIITSGERRIVLNELAARSASCRGGVLRPNILLNIVFFEVRTGETFIGKSRSNLGDKKSSIMVSEIDSDLSCTGQSTFRSATHPSAGTLASGTLLCKDGRTIEFETVHESYFSGWGIGSSASGSEFRVIFGLPTDLELDKKSLRQQFKSIKNKRKPKGFGRQA